MARSCPISRARIPTCQSWPSLNTWRPGYSENGERLARDASLRQGDAQAQGLDQAALRRGQAVARAGAGSRAALDNVHGEALLIATGQNLTRLLSWRGWGRRPWPDGAPG